MNPRNSINDLILAYTKERGFHHHTVERWLGLSEPDREALLTLARGLNIGQNHLRDLLDWLNEIQLRDGVSCAEILNREELSRIMSDPRLAGIEEKIQKKIRELKLKSQVVISVPPGLEGGTLSIQLTATGQEELKRLMEQVGDVVARDEMNEIFALLRGEG